MPNNTTLTVRIDPVVKQQAQTILNDLGLDMNRIVEQMAQQALDIEKNAKEE